MRSAVLLAAVTAACSDVADPGGGGPLPFAVGLTVEAAAGGPAEAYAQADEIAVTVRAGGAVVLQETQPFDPDAAETRVRVRLERELAGSTVAVEAELRGDGAALFRGSGSALLEPSGPSTLNVPLTAVVSGVVAADPAATFTAIGETLQLSAAAVFATGDTVPGAPVTWRTLDPSVVTISGATATAHAEGTARLEASAGGATVMTTATVEAEVARISVSPPAATVSIGQSASFEAQAFDRNANPLVRTFAWSSSNDAVATTTAEGTATGVTSGVAEIIAAAGGAQGVAVLTVVDVPLAPGDLSGSVIDQAALTYRLTWEDRSVNETYFSIERSVEGAFYEEVGRTRADVTTFEAMGVPGDVDFRVLACNTIGCSPPSNVVSLTFEGGPPVATTQDSPDIGVMAGRVTGATPYTVRFQYGFDPEDFVEGGLEGECPCYEETAPVEGVGTQDFELPVDLWYAGDPLYYRIVASNEFGESVGALESTVIPDVDADASGPWDYGGSVTLRAEVFATGGGNPVESVVFELTGFNPPYSTVLSDGTASESSSSGGTVYTYSRNWNVPDSDNLIGGTIFVDVIVTFRSGATAYANFLTIPQESEATF